ncbi:MAG: response regulator [Rhodospirillales bacterium]
MDSAPKILIVEDNRELRELISKSLKKEGYRVRQAGDGREMLHELDQGRVDLIVLDIMLPGQDGLVLCRNLRAKSTTPIVFVSAKNDDLDKVLGLKMGADDYIAKPFSMAELSARIEAVLRRVDTGAPVQSDDDLKGYRFSRWLFDLERRELIENDDIIVPLSTGEFNLLSVFVQRPNRVLSRDQLLDFTHGRDVTAFDRSIDTQVSRLRRKIEADPREPQIIKTVWGGGYVFTVDVSRE